MTAYTNLSVYMRQYKLTLNVTTFINFFMTKITVLLKLQQVFGIKKILIKSLHEVTYA